MEATATPEPAEVDGPVVLYDGSCGLCSRAVEFILAHEADSELRFASQDSPAGRELIHRFSLERAAGGTVILIEDGRFSIRSTAALRLCRRLRRPWRWLTCLLLVPRPMGDAVYTAVARMRHRLFRRSTACALPPGVDPGRFLDAGRPGRAS